MAGRLQSVGLVVCHAGLVAQHVGASRARAQAVSLRLVSGFLSTGLPGKPLIVHLECMVVSIASHHFQALVTRMKFYLPSYVIRLIVYIGT